MRIRKTDRNHAELIEQIRKIPGVTVIDTHTLPKFVDCVVGVRGVNYLLEIKDPKKPPSGRKLTKDQKKLHSVYTGTIHVVEKFDDVLKIING